MHRRIAAQHSGQPREDRCVRLTRFVPLLIFERQPQRRTPRLLPGARTEKHPARGETHAGGRQHRSRTCRRPRPDREARSQRKDDTEEVVTRRFEEYKAKTEPVLGYYQAKNLVTAVSGVGPLDEVYKRIRAAVGPV